MEAGRDDFIIAIRSAFLNKSNKQRFSLVGLIFFSVILILLGKLNFTPINYLKIGIKEIVYRSSFIVSVPENYIKDTYQKIQNHFYLYEETSKIKDELKKFKEKDITNKFIISENERLKKLLNDYVIDSEENVAKVLIDKQSPFLKSIVLNKGSKNNIKLGMAVLDSEYLVGKVVEVNYLTSRVILLSDLNSKIPVIIEPSGYQFILSGTGKNNGIIQYSKDNYEISEENIVYTSGAGALFKAGIPIGKIKNIKSKNEKNVEFFSDLSQLKFVKIISYIREIN